MNTLVVVPAYNEEKNIEKVIADLVGNCGHDILVVDDASSDATGSLVRNMKCENCKVLTLPCNLGAWKATQTGIRYAYKYGYNRVVTFDADGQHGASDIEGLLSALNEGADTVVGACIDRAGRSKALVWKVLRKLSGISVNDITSGFRAYEYRAMKILSAPSASMLEYQDVGVLALLHSHGCVITEVEVTMSSRLEGKSKIFGSYLGVLRYMIYSLILGLAKKR